MPNGATTSYTLRWQNNDLTGDELGFIIERSTAGGAFVQIATVGPSVTSYQDTTALAGVIYQYRVCAYNAQGNSAFTNTVSDEQILESMTVIGKAIAPVAASLADIAAQLTAIASKA
jgi:fibronectin type III domain protein